MKVQSNQPSGVPPAGPPQDTDPSGGSSKFSEVLDKKSHSESSSSSSAQDTSHTQQAQQTQQSSSNQQAQTAQPNQQTEPQPVASQQEPMMEARQAEVGESFPPLPGEQPFPGQPGEMVARSFTPPGAAAGQGLAGPPLDPLASADALGVSTEPPVPGQAEGVEGVPLMTPGMAADKPAALPGAIGRPGGPEFQDAMVRRGIAGTGQPEGGPHVQEAAGDATIPLGEGDLLPGGGDPALTPEAAAAQASRVARHGKEEGTEGKEFSLKKGDEEAEDELDAAEVESEKLAPGAMQAMLSQQQTPDVQAVERPRPLHEMQQIRSIVQEVRMVAKPGDKTQIDIQLTSKTLDGLQIKIERGEEGRMRIDFVTKNDDVAQLLSRNMQNLSQSLAAHGLRVSNIQIVNPAAQAMAASFAAQPRPIETFASSSDSGRDDRGERGEREGRQQGGGDQQGQGGRRGRQ
ncbi:MAG: flagellar hook-length control protein FliK [Bryobacteraceae bacterium]